MPCDVFMGVHCCLVNETYVMAWEGGGASNVVMEVERCAGVRGLGKIAEKRRVGILRIISCGGLLSGGVD